MKIVTRGFGLRHMIMTRGYGRSIVERILREIIKLSTSFNQTIHQSTAFTFIVRLVTAVNIGLRLISRVGGMAERIWLATNLNRALRVPTIMQMGRIFLGNIAQVANRILLACGFDLRSRDE